MNELAIAIGLFGLWAVVVHNAIMIHMLAKDNKHVNPILPDGGKK